MKDEKDFFKGFYTGWLDFNMKMAKASVDMAQQFWSPESYEKFYSCWSENMAGLMEEMMKAPGFTENSWKAFKSTVGFQKFWEMMTRTYMKNMNIPTREEFEEVLQRLDYTDDRLDKIEQKLEQLLKSKEKE